jgi:ABC-type uncharacterized transport system permease subunit
MPGTDAKLLILLALVAYAMTGFLTLAGRRGERKTLTRLGLVLLAAAISTNLAALALRLARGHGPTASGFDTFAVLALLAGAATAYLRRFGALPGSELASPPIAAVCALLAVVLSGDAYRGFARDVWNVAHVSSAVAAVACFALAAGGGLLYLRLYRRLRSKDPAVLDSPAPSLERLNRLIRGILPIGFALLTVTIIAGLVGALQPEREGYFRAWWTHPKILASAGAWCLYAVALHAAYARRFRVRAAAVLSAVGFVLLIAVLLASMLMPET